MSQENLISTIIPVYNRAETVVRAVSSILQQDYRPIEIILVDDGSTDNTPDVIRELCNEHPGIVFSFNQRNRGAGKARQLGLEQANGGFIQYLDSDDTILPGKFSTQFKLLSKYKDCMLALGLTRGIPMLVSTGKSADDYPEHTNSLYPSILNNRWWTTSTPLYRYKAARYAQWGDVTVLEDWEYEFQIAAKGAKYCFYPDYVVDKSNDADDQLSLYKETNRALWLESKARVMRRIIARVFEANLERNNEDFTRFLNKIIKTGEEALEYSRSDISKDMASLAMRSMMKNIRPNFIKRTVKLYYLSMFSGGK